MKTFSKRRRAPFPPSEPRDLSAAEKFAVQWLGQHEFEYDIVWQGPLKTKFRVSRGETVYHLDVEREDPDIAITMRKFEVLFEVADLVRTSPHGVRRYFAACDTCPYYREEATPCELRHKTYFLTFFPHTRCPRCKEEVQRYKQNKFIQRFWCGL